MYKDDRNMFTKYKFLDASKKSSCDFALNKWGNIMLNISKCCEMPLATITSQDYQTNFLF